LIAAAFEYTRAGSIEDALEALADPEARAIAGGHSLVPMMKLRLARPSRLVDIGGLDFRGVTDDREELRIGALTTYDELVRLDAALGLPDALRECASSVGDLQVRNAGTVGGGIAHGDPASDLAAGVLALEARLRIRSTSGTRECPADEFFLGPFTTALEQQELLTEILVPRPRLGEGSAYASITDPASGYPLAGAAARIRVEAGRIVSCTVGLTGIGACPARVSAVEAAVLGGDLPVARAVSGALVGRDLVDDDPYRRQLVAVTVTRALETACARASGSHG